MTSQTQLFGLALQFMTRLPVPWSVAFDPDAQAQSARYYPAVGLVVGVISALGFAVAGLIFDPLLAALIAFALTTLVTGALHEDGLADTADGLGGSADRARALDIMRDHTVGTYGVMALLIVFTARVFAVSSLPLTAGCIALILSAVVSRYVCVWMIYAMDYARSEGANFAAPRIDRAGHRFALLWAAVIAVGGVALAGFGVLLGLCLAAGVVVWLTRLYERRLQGYTGDGLGAAQQLSELALIVGIAAWL